MTPDDTRTGRTRRQLDPQLVEALARGLTYDRAAQLVGCSASTVDRRLRDPAFRERVQQARSERVARTADKLSALAEAATAVLADALTSGTPAHKLRAALAVPGMAARHYETVTLEARLDALEAALQATPTPLRAVKP